MFPHYLLIYLFFSLGLFLVISSSANTSNLGGNKQAVWGRKRRELFTLAEILMRCVVTDLLQWQGFLYFKVMVNVYWLSNVVDIEQHISWVISGIPG